MKDRPLAVTEDEVHNAEMDLDFEFFANLIRYPQPIETDARHRAADVVLRYMRGEVSKRQRGMLQTLANHRKMAARVNALKDQYGSLATNGISTQLTNLSSSGLN